jgi:MFS family permease
MNTIHKIWNSKFILLTTTNFLLCVTYYSIISTLPLYLVNELKAGKSDVGIVLAAYTIASIIIRPFGGFSLDKFGRRTIYLLALSLYALFFCGYLFATTITLLIILRFMQGITWGVTTIAGSTIAVDIIPENKRGEGIGYFALSTTLGMSIGPLIGLFFCHHFGYTAMFIAGIIASIISLICATLVKLPPIPTVNVQFSWQNLFDKKSVIPSLNLLIIMITYGGLLTFIALYGREMGIQNTSLFFLVFSIGIASSRLIAGKSFDKEGPTKILTLCLSLLVMGFLLLVIFRNAIGFYISAIIIGYGIGVVFPVFQAIINNLADPLRRGAANSTLFTCLDLGMGSGMVIMGYVAQYSSISVTFIISSAIGVAGLVFFRKITAPYYQKHLNDYDK